MGKSASSLVMLATGGTGGHVFPAQALAQELAARSWNVLLLVDDRGQRYLSRLPDAVRTEITSSATFWRGGLASRAAAPMRILGGMLSGLNHILRNSPSVVVGFGGYAAFPAVAAALALRKPCMIHEQNCHLGKANRALSGLVDVVACGARTATLPGGSKGVFTGNPVRSDFLECRDRTYDPPAPGRARILVLGGSQGADVLDRTVPEAIGELPAELRGRLHVVQQARGNNVKHVRENYRGMSVDCQVQPFFDDVPRHLAEAQLVISRAGASTVAEITAVGRPAILVPFAAAVNDHQSENARGLVKSGAAVAIDESALTPTGLARALLDLLEQPRLALDMAAASRACGVPDAARQLADQVERLAGPRRNA